MHMRLVQPGSTCLISTRCTPSSTEPIPWFYLAFCEHNEHCLIKEVNLGLLLLCVQFWAQIILFSFVLRVWHSFHLHTWLRLKIHYAKCLMIRLDLPHSQTGKCKWNQLWCVIFCLQGWQKWNDESSGDEGMMKRVSLHTPLLNTAFTESKATVSSTVPKFKLHM